MQQLRRLTARSRTRGTFDWAVPDADVHTFINERQRAIGTYLYGWRMYETMRGWVGRRCHLYLVLVLVGGGKPWLPGPLRRTLNLIDVHQCANDTVYLRYHVDT